MKRILFAAAGAALLLVSLSPTAWAHPAYKDSDPKSGATVATPPSELWVEFTESIEGGFVHVYDPCGERVDHGESERNLTNDRITVGTHGDKAGAYRVQWEVLGSDSHTTRGEFTFTSSGGDSCPVAEEDEPDEPSEPEERDDDTNTRAAPGTGDTRSDTDASDRTSRERDSSNEPRHQRRRRVQENEVANRRLLAQEETPDPEQTSAEGIWDGIPMGDFFVALAIAALIGAAGGRIYAGILGPRR